VRRDWAWALAVPFILAAVLWDGWFSRVDAIALMGIFVIWLGIVIRHAGKHSAGSIDGAKISSTKAVAQATGGLVLLVVAAQFVVYGGKGVAVALGWSPFIVGAVVVSVATGTPEMATTVMSRWRGHHDVGLGNILGSNLFNALFIAALAALIHPSR
jgi:cation:H+ antiporter